MENEGRPGYHERRKSCAASPIADIVSARKPLTGVSGSIGMSNNQDSSTLPKANRGRRWWRFVMATILTLTILVLFYSKWSEHRHRALDRAIAEIEKFGGEVTPYRRTSSPDLDRLRKLVGKERVESVFNNQVSVQLGDSQITDDGLVHLKDIPNLDWLNLYNTQITDDGLAHLKRLTKLRGLFLNDTNISDAGLIHLENLRSLRSLSLEDTKVTFEGVKKLQKALRDCDISYNTGRQRERGR